jgi:hypothetical protein
MSSIPGVIADLRTSLHEAADANPVFLRPSEKAEALIELGRIEAQVHELRLRVLAVSQDLAEDIGARDPAAWLVAQALTDPTPATRDLALARALETWEHVRTGLAAGAFSVEHARIIIRSLEALPADLPAEVIASAERDLCEYATHLRPKDLRVCGKRILHTTTPEIADQEDERAILRLEAEVDEKVTLSISPQGDGTSRVYALVPEAIGERLRVLLESFAQPRIAALDVDGTPRPRNRVMADAFGELLECVDPAGLHDHGGDTTTVLVTMTLEQLRADLTATGIAEIAGVDISAGEARRLLCTANVIPLVLGGRSEPLDLGRTKRLHSGPQRKAMRIRDQHCRAEGCTVPATWCDGHHDDFWSHGGRTDIESGALLCGHHHRLVHNPAYQTTRLPSGDYRFTRLATTATTGTSRFHPRR